MQNSKSKIKVVLALALSLLALSACDSRKAARDDDAPPANALVKTAEKGPVLLTVRAWPAAPRLSDMVTLQITIDAPPGVEVVPPQFRQAIGDFLVRDYRERSPKLLSDTLRRHEILYKLDPTFAGKHLIRSVSAQFRDTRADSKTKDELQLVESEPIELNVTSELGDRTPNLADLAPMSAPRPLPRNWLWLWLAGGAVLLAGGVGYALWWRRRHRQVRAAERVLSPEEIAAAELSRLLAEDLHGRGQFKEFYVRLTGIVRRYIEQTTGIRAPEQTTEEFLQDMRRKQVFPPERSAQLAQFLQSADMVKYAAQQPGQRQLEEAIGRAQEFVGLPSAFHPMPEEIQK